MKRLPFFMMAWLVVIFYEPAFKLEMLDVLKDET